MDELTKSIQVEVHWCMLFVNDIVLVDEIKSGANDKLEIQCEALESKDFRLMQV